MQKELYKDLYDLETKHWWFLGKKEIILHLLKKYFRPGPNKQILDAGCGSGLMLTELAKIGETSGMDFSEEAIKFSKINFHGPLKQGSLPNNVPYPLNHFDLIVALDVIEHIDDDSGSIKSLSNLLKKDGLLLITVPAYQFLWSAHDTIHQHKRRYTLRQLKSKITAAGLKIEKISYYNTLLFIPIFLIRIIHKILKKTDSGSDAKMPSPPINGILKNIFSLEKYLLNTVNLPFGVSIIAIARKTV